MSTTKYIYSNQNIIQEIKEELESEYRKNYINGLGIDDIIGYDQEESSMSYNDRKELTFCNNRVNPYSGEFLEYGYTGMVERCNNLVISGENQINITNRYFYNKDHLGSIVGISDLSGNKVIEYDYDVFGKTYVKVGTGEYVGLDLYTGNFYNNSRLYTAREYDGEIGLYFYRARYYDTNIGRFISRDPIGQVDNVHLYTYVGNNSVNYVDPSGEVKKLIKKWWEKDVKEDIKQFKEGFVDGIDFIPIVGDLKEVYDYGKSFNENDWKQNTIGLGMVLMSFTSEGDLSKLGGKLIGKVNPNMIRFTQDSISKSFGKGGGSVEEFIKKLKTGEVKAENVPAIRIFEKNGEWYSLDNRRLKAFQEAGIDIQYIIADPTDVKNEMWKFTTKNEGTSIEFRSK